MFDSRHVRVFAEVVRTGSYTAAARNLGYTQPAISQQMKALERAVGTPLFTRVGRRLRLTEAGEVLSGHAEGILDAMSAAQEQMTAIARLRSGHVRVAAFPSASATLVPQTTARVMAEHPGIRIELLEAEPPDSLDMLVRGECDITLAFGYDETPAPPEELVEVPLLDDPLVVLLPAGHPLTEEGSVELRALAGERWIAGCRRCRGHFAQACRAVGFTPDIAFTTDDNLAVQSLVASGVGVALMPQMVLSFLRHPKVTGRPLTPMGRRRISAYTLPSHQRIPAARLMLGALRQTADARTAEVQAADVQAEDVQAAGVQAAGVQAADGQTTVERGAPESVGTESERPHVDAAGRALDL
ncbi:LysR family transcriptional regulator [Nocardiopsis rhodophaea]|uniref:LysR family transcriptional regulator n=1 Tax=Nocardiopsis rhodophaea TaxID=280238 RepID=UPI0031D79229